MISERSLKVRLLEVLLRFTPTLGRTHYPVGDKRNRVRNPLWHVVFSYLDDARHCGCWREAGLRRWQ